MFVVLISLAIATLLLGLVGIVALLSLLRLQRGYAANRVLSQRSQPVDLSLAISCLTPTVQPSVTVHHPHVTQVASGRPILPVEEIPTQPEKPIIKIQPDIARSEAHNVQPLLDYLKAALAERTG